MISSHIESFLFDAKLTKQWTDAITGKSKGGINQSKLYYNIRMIYEL